MAFENVFGNVDFGIIPRARQMEANRFQEALGQGIAAYNAGQDRKQKERLMEMKAQNGEGFKLQKAAEMALYNKSRGQPYDKSAIIAYSQYKGSPSYTDILGNVVQNPTLAQRAGVSGGIPAPTSAQVGGANTLTSPRPPNISMSAALGLETPQQNVIQPPLIDDSVQRGAPNPNLGKRGQLIAEEAFQKAKAQKLKLEGEKELSKFKKWLELPKEQREKQSAYNLKSVAGRTVLEDAGRALSILDDSMNGITSGQSVAGIGGVTIGKIPFSKAGSMKKHVESIKSNIAIDSLLKIKASGAGLGQVPQQQLMLLARLLGELDVNSDPQLLRDNLARVSNIYVGVLRDSKDDLEKLGLIDNQGLDFLDNYKPYKLSFDEFGKPIEDKPQQSQEPLISQSKVNAIQAELARRKASKQK